MKKKLEKITEETILADLLSDKGAKRILKENKIPCVNCSSARYEVGYTTLGKITGYYQIDTKKLINELNNYLSSGERDEEKSLLTRLRQNIRPYLNKFRRKK